MENSSGSPQTSHRKTQAVIWIAVGAIVVFVLAISFLRLMVLYDRVADDSDVTADVSVLERAEDAVRSAELVLGFLEGASVLLAVALGTAAIYGFSQVNEIQERLESHQQAQTAELNSKLRELREEFNRELDTNLKEVTRLLAEINPYRSSFERVPELVHQLEESRQVLDDSIGDVALLLQADQEFRLRNYQVAYDFAKDVLLDPVTGNQELQKPLPLALFIMGWMEIHHIPNKIDDGLRHLEAALHKQPHWHSVRAAYGVGLRRKGMQLFAEQKTAEFRNMMNRAEGELRSALGSSPNLVDFNRESFWGPVGGLLRDTGRIDEAITAYEKALTVTPGSSYPQGNLASLYLYKSKIDSSFDLHRVLDAFELAEQFALAELAIAPNDFFLLMDISMANVVLGQRDEARFERSEAYFERAMNMQDIDNLIHISYRGWTFLLENCPDDDSWKKTRAELHKRLDTIREVL